MCDFFSFVICSNGKVLTGNRESHEGISKGWNLKRGSYREAEWVGENWDSLSVRVEPGEDKSYWLSNVLAVCPTKKRSDFLKLFTMGKAEDGVFHLKDGKLHRTDGPAVEFSDGSKSWYIDDKRHRTEGPSIEWSNGRKEWWVDGKQHRTDGPAIEWENGSKAWYVDGKQHRTDGPAVERANWDKEWYVDGKLHRTDGPAIEWTSGTKMWWVNDKQHRTDGPAVEYPNGDKEWWVNDKKYSKEEFDKLTF